MTFNAKEHSRAEQYARKYGISLGDNIGWGVDGVVVFSVDRQVALKALRGEQLYRQELAVYLRLRELDIHQICGFAVPRLLRHDDELWVLEMEVVVPPFVVDFVAASLDRRPEFPIEVERETERNRRAMFGKNWSKVKSLMSGFARYGIYLSDVKPGNITFGKKRKGV